MQRLHPSLQVWLLYPGGPLLDVAALNSPCLLIFSLCQLSLKAKSPTKKTFLKKKQDISDHHLIMEASVCQQLNNSCCCVSIHRGGPHQGECGGHNRCAVGRRRHGGRVRLRQTEAPLLHQSNDRTGAEGPVGGRHGDVRVLLLGRLHPAGQADIQAVWRPFYPHLVRHHLELPLLSPLLHRPPVQESGEADAQTEIQVRRCHRSASGIIYMAASFFAGRRKRKRKRGWIA